MCEFCMRNLDAGLKCGKDYPIRPCANGDLGVRATYLNGGDCPPKRSSCRQWIF